MSIMHVLFLVQRNQQSLKFFSHQRDPQFSIKLALLKIAFALLTSVHSLKCDMLVCVTFVFISFFFFLI